MGLKSITNGQINIAKSPTDQVSLKNKSIENKSIPDATAPLAADKKFGASYLGNFNRARVEQKFADQQQVQQDNAGETDVTTKTELPMTIEKAETQESVLKRTYLEMAKKAGISEVKAEGADKSLAEMFVEERMEANKPAEGDQTIRILNADTQKPYTDTEWAELQKSGTITMSPTTNDVEILKSYKGTESADFKAGQAAADKLMNAVNAGFNIWNYKPLSSETVPPAVSDALAEISRQSGNGDFQEGLINRLGADNFLKAEKYLNGTAYESVMRNSLSVASQDRGGTIRVSTNEQTVQQQIAQKADAETLSHLTSDENRQMSKDFLVAAGKNIAQYGNGWRTVDRGMATQNAVDPNTAKVFEAIGKNKEASAELLKDGSFVKNALSASEAGLADDGKASNALGSIIKSALTPDFVKNNPAQARQILSNISNVLAKPDDIARVKLYGISSNLQTVREETAEALG